MAVAGTPIGPEGLPQLQGFLDTLNWLLAEGFVNGKRTCGEGDFRSGTCFVRRSASAHTGRLRFDPGRVHVHESGENGQPEF
jgi:hypothetical protein